MSDRQQFLDEVKRRFQEFNTAPFDERQYTAYASQTTLMQDIKRLMDIVVALREERDNAIEAANEMANHQH